MFERERLKFRIWCGSLEFWQEAGEQTREQNGRKQANRTRDGKTATNYVILFLKLNDRYLSLLLNKVSVVSLYTSINFTVYGGFLRHHMS